LPLLSVSLINYSVFLWLAHSLHMDARSWRKYSTIVLTNEFVATWFVLKHIKNNIDMDSI